MSFDLDAAVSAESNQPFDFTFRGQSFSLPLALPVSLIDKLKAVEEDDLPTILRTLLGDEQGSRFIALDPADTHIKALVEEYAKVKGVSLGELAK